MTKRRGNPTDSLSPAKGADYLNKHFNRLTVALLFSLLILALPLKAKAATLAQPTLTKVANKSSGVQLTWTKTSKANGYVVMRASGSGAMKKIKTISGGTTLTWTDTTVKSGKSYRYAIRARRKTSSKTTYSTYDRTGVTITYLTRPTLSKIKDSNAGLVLSWNQISGAKGYYVYRKEGSGSYEKLKKIKSASTVTYTDTTAAYGVSYTYAVTAYGASKSARSKDKTGVHTLSSSPDAGRTYRALLIGQCAYEPAFYNPSNINGDQSSNLYAPYYDARAMRSMLSVMHYSRTTLLDNATRSQILSAISTAFSGATSNDVSLFYYSGHGSTSYNSTYSGALVTPGSNGVDEYLTLRELADALNKIPGRVVVILDSCGSGAAVQNNEYVSAAEDGPEETANGDPLDPDLFNQSVWSAFYRPQTSSIVRPKYGELAQNDKFYVITASRTWQTSLELRPVYSGYPYSLLTYYLVTGGGFDYNLYYSGRIPADRDSDKAVSLWEAYQYAYGRVLQDAQFYEGEQNIQYFPLYSTQTIYYR